MADLTGSKILITGGAGFVGSYVVEQLLDEDVQEIIVIDNMMRGCVDNLEKALASNKVKLIEGDIRDQVLLKEYLKGMDYCVHLAALRITQCAQEPREALEIMYDGTFNVLEECVQQKIKRLFLASTASVYGQADSFPTTEEHHPYNNYTLYGAAKMANELMCRSYSQMYDLKFNACRYFNIYGPRMDTEGKYTEVLIRWYRLIKEGKQPLIYGDGRQTMDFIYVTDVAYATVLAMKSEAVNDIFNVASSRETSLEELCFTLLDVMGSKLTPRYIPLPEDRKKVEVMRRLADITKAKEQLGFEPQIDLKEGLKQLVEWLETKESNVSVA